MLPRRTDLSDLLNELLFGMRLSGLRFRRVAVHAGMGVCFTNPSGRAQFHFLARGPAWLRSPSGALHALVTGDALLIPRGGHHVILGSTGIASDRVLAFDPSAAGAPWDAGPPDGALVFSGCMQLDLGSMQPLVDAMPEAMLASTLMQAAPEVGPLLDAMEREATLRQAGQAGIMARLAEVVAALIVRTWAAKGCGDADGWLAALDDPRLSSAIAAMHKDPGRAWTVEALAKEAGSSRSVFAQRFVRATGATPLRYLTALRMRLAVRRLGQDGAPVEAVAHELGYGSLAAFSRAFKRTVGVPPGASRGGPAAHPGELADPDG